MSETLHKAATPAAPVKKARQGRSPAFPFVPLGTALGRAELFRVAEGGRPRHYSPLASAAAAWSMGSKTGNFLQTVAALGHFELFEFQGGGDNRAVRLTETALRILLDKQPISPERDALVSQIALAPRIHAELWQRWEVALPSNATIETYLVRDRSFSETGARDLISEYKETIAFAKLGQPAIIPPVNDGEVKADPANQEIEVGDLIQVEIDGSLALEKPDRVRAVQEHEGRRWVFVETSETGIPMDQTVLIEKGTGEIKPPVVAPTLPLKAADATHVPVAAGEKEWLRGPLSREASYRLIVSGELGPKEIGKLIKVLQAQQAVLSDDEE